jgi:hypothetical protein
VNLFLSDLLNVDNLSQGITRQVPLGAATELLTLPEQLSSISFILLLNI